YNLRWRGLAQYIQHRLRMDAYEKIQGSELSYLENTKSGELSAALNDDVNQLERFFDNGANTLIQTLSTVVLVGAVFFYISPDIAILAMIPIPVIIIGAFYYQGKADPLYTQVRN